MRATARAQPNIALIKYWGKSDVHRNLPAVGSISITLNTLYTTMSVDFGATLPDDVLTVNGAEDAAMLPRISRCLDTVCGEDRPRARVASHCNFPIAAGLASSASAFAALVVAADAAGGGSRDRAELASLAGLASGSAARSLFGGFCELENTGNGIDVCSLRLASEWPLEVVVAVTEKGPKPTGSTEAMEISRKTSPFYRRWVEQQESDLAAARDAILKRDFGKLGDVAEHNCLKMHSVMWASRPPLIYWNHATLECMHAVRELRDQGTGVFFTIDAGPQLKAVCLPEHTERVKDALASTRGVHDVMVSGLGSGARLVDDDV